MLPAQVILTPPASNTGWMTDSDLNSAFKTAQKRSELVCRTYGLAVPL